MSLAPFHLLTLVIAPFCTPDFSSDFSSFNHLEKQLHRYWNAISHEIGLHWYRGLEARVWDLVRYPTWLISDGALFDFCVTQLSHTWKEEDWLIERGFNCNQEQWQLMQTLATQVG